MESKKIIQKISMLVETKVVVGTTNATIIITITTIVMMINPLDVILITVHLAFVLKENILSLIIANI